MYEGKGKNSGGVVAKEPVIGIRQREININSEKGSTLKLCLLLSNNLNSILQLRKGFMKVN